MEDIKRRGTTRGGLGTAASRVRTPATTIVSSIPCPFSISPEGCIVPPNTTQEFKITFLPVDADDFVYLLKGETPPVAAPAVDPTSTASTAAAASNENHAIGSADPSSSSSYVRMVLRGTAKRPVCHFEMKG